MAYYKNDKVLHAKIVRERYDRLKESGVCVLCGSEPAANGVVHCVGCREKANSRSRAKSRIARDNGLCYRCKKNKCESGTICNSCKPTVRKTARESQRRLNEERIAAGICVDCKNPTDDPSSSGRCLRCQCYSIRHSLNGRVKSSVSVDDLVEIWNRQYGVCELTGLNMKLADAELDHVVPVHGGGPSSVENLRWVLKAANRMKGKLSDAELVEMCKLIISHLEK